MSKTSKSLRKVLEVALRAAQQSLPEYSHEFSPKKFTQHQLFACLVLKSFLKTDYRGVIEYLRDCPLLGETIGLSKIPHFTTLQTAARRLLKRKDVDQLIGSTLKLAKTLLEPVSRFISHGNHSQYHDPLCDHLGFLQIRSGAELAVW